MMSARWMAVKNVLMDIWQALKDGVVSIHQLRAVLPMIISGPIDVLNVALTECLLIHGAISNHNSVMFRISIYNV